MKPHVKLYLAHFGYDETDFVPCECCKAKAIDIHHIKSRGMGGTKKEEDIINIMALCRLCHEKFGDKKQFKEYLERTHMGHLAKLI